MTPAMEQMVAIIREIRIKPSITEYELQEQIQGLLVAHGIIFEKEYKLGPRNRVDFMLRGGIIIETKKGKPYYADIIGQLERYAGFDEVTGMILLVERNLLHFPGVIGGKPVYYLGLNKLWGIAL
jgi:hypothetical protein